MTHSYDRNAYRFFRQHAGYIVGESAKGALALARAEKHAGDEGLQHVWVEDPDPDLSWMDEHERAQEHEVLGCILYRPCSEHGVDCKHAEPLASLWGIVDADREYRRVIEAELSLEALKH